MNRRPHIFIIGLTGCGKTTLGAALAKRLERPFFDIDGEIVIATGQSVDELFNVHGEPGFRNIETKILEQICNHHIPSVIATGGGVVLEPKNIWNMSGSGIVIRIQRKPELILSNLDVEGRPLLAKNPERIHVLARERELLYRQAADYTVQNDDRFMKTLEDMVMIYESDR